MENVDMLYSFVASMLDIPLESISEIKITNPELPPESLEGKFSRLDLNLKVDNRLVNVEIQVKNEPDYRYPNTISPSVSATEGDLFKLQEL